MPQSPIHSSTEQLEPEHDSFTVPSLPLHNNTGTSVLFGFSLDHLKIQSEQSDDKSSTKTAPRTTLGSSIVMRTFCNCTDAGEPTLFSATNELLHTGEESNRVVRLVQVPLALCAQVFVSNNTAASHHQHLEEASSRHRDLETLSTQDKSSEENPHPSTSMDTAASPVASSPEAGADILHFLQEKARLELGLHRLQNFVLQFLHTLHNHLAFCTHVTTGTTSSGQQSTDLVDICVFLAALNERVKCLLGRRIQDQARTGFFDVSPLWKVSSSQIRLQKQRIAQDSHESVRTSDNLSRATPERESTVTTHGSSRRLQEDDQEEAASFYVFARQEERLAYLRIFESELESV
ncbi:unnamed protein product, partial [Amoebophrya sp. A25]|eukprot:GSA25T00026516001.1